MDFSTELFPFSKKASTCEEGGRLLSFKWQQGSIKYEIHADILDTMELSVLTQHVLDVRSKVKNIVSTDAHIAPSLFKVLPRTLSERMREDVWDLCRDEEPSVEETLDGFDIILKRFIDTFATADDQHQLIQQLQKPTKPREVMVQAFYYQLKKLNGYIPWLPGTASKLTDPQLKEAFYDGMPNAWRVRFVHAGQSRHSMTMPELVRYFRSQEHSAMRKQLENSAAQHHASRNSHKVDKSTRSSSERKPASAPREQKKRSHHDTNSKPSTRIADSTDCPIHPGMGHTWGKCRSNAYNEERKKARADRTANDKGSSKQPQKKAGYATTEVNSDVSVESFQKDQDEEQLPDAKGEQNGYWTIPCIEELDSYLATSVFADVIGQSECNNSECLHSYVTQSEELYNHGLQTTNPYNQFDIHEPITNVQSSLKVRPIGLLIAQAIQGHKSQKPLPQTIKWDDVILPWQPRSYFQDKNLAMYIEQALVHYAESSTVCVCRKIMS